MTAIRLPLLALLLATFLSGCMATGPVFTEVPAGPDSAVLYVYRPPNFTNSAHTPSVLVNSQDLGKIATGGYMVVKLSPGWHDVELAVPGFEGRSAISVVLQPGDLAYARIDTQMAGVVMIERTFAVSQQPAATAGFEITTMRHVATVDLRTRASGP